MAEATAPYEDGLSVSELRRQFTDWQDTKWAEQQERSEADHYYHDDQWTKAEVAALKKRKQPIITFNREKRKIDGVVGTLKKLWQDAKAYPRSPNHDQDAEIASSALKYALDKARWKTLGVQETRTGGKGGIGNVALTIEQGDRGDPEIGLEAIDETSFFYDPRSVKPDFSDARYMGETKWLDADDAKELYRDKAEEIDELVSRGGDIDSTLQQKDREQAWVNIKAKKLRVVEHWYLKGGAWHVCHYSGDTKLYSAASPWADEQGKPMAKYIAFSAYIDHDGDRYGFHRTLKSAQDELNMRRSKALHNLNTRRIKMERGAVDEKDGIERLRIEAARNDGVMIYNKGFEFEFDDPQKAQEWQGQMEMLAEAKSEIENFGPALVEKGMEKSGRAIALLQQAGLSELGPFIDSWSDWKLRVYRAVWNAIRKHWTAERWIRVTDDEGAARFVQLNGFTIDEYGQPQMVNQVAALDVDIILDEAPDTVNTMADVFELLESLAAAGVPVPPEIVIEMSGLPASIKKSVIAKLQQAQQPDPMAEKAKQIALAGEEAKVGKTVADTEKSRADAEAKKVKSFTDIAGIRMDAERMDEDRLSNDRDFQGRNADRAARSQPQPMM